MLLKYLRLSFVTLVLFVTAFALGACDINTAPPTPTATIAPVVVPPTNTVSPATTLTDTPTVYVISRPLRNIPPLFLLPHQQPKTRRLSAHPQARRAHPHPLLSRPRAQAQT